MLDQHSRCRHRLVLVQRSSLPRAERRGGREDGGGWPRRREVCVRGDGLGVHTEDEAGEALDESRAVEVGGLEATKHALGLGGDAVVIVA